MMSAPCCCLGMRLQCSSTVTTCAQFCMSSASARSTTSTCAPRQGGGRETKLSGQAGRRTPATPKPRPCPRPRKRQAHLHAAKEVALALALLHVLCQLGGQRDGAGHDHVRLVEVGKQLDRALGEADAQPEVVVQVACGGEG